MSDVSAIPCQQYDIRELAALADEYEEKIVTLCSYVDPQHDKALQQLHTAHLTWKQERETNDDFWDDWLGLSDSPVLSSESNSTFYGVGLWMPEKYEDVDILRIEDAEEWIKNHGLQMSLGMMGNDSRSPRVRLDYRWHNDDNDDVFLQVEIPIQ
ncbi:hypothetical protein [uncultured Photobacterium sp.]|uniref:hypothetical protein n=1 Tax=uncultured Photobacterium sp. TaxID=173973 RepID=UPI002604788F|nr:hypothetical protein [uncultured Photobacterium sp.]